MKKNDGPLMPRSGIQFSRTTWGTRGTGWRRLIDNWNRIAMTPEAMPALGVASGDHIVLDVQEGMVRVVPVDWVPRHR